MRPQLIDLTELRSQLDRIPNWETDGKSISRNFEGKSFAEVIKWVVAIAAQAEQLDHHPDIDIRWTMLSVRLTTHDQGGLTQLDIDSAIAIDLICT